MSPQIWLPTTRALGDLNNYTSDFRAIEGSNLLSSDPAEAAATEKEMADLDRTIAHAEREFERIRHDAAENDLYRRFKERWTEYRAIVNQMLELSRSNRKAAALAIYGGTSRTAYNAASDTLGQLTDRAVANAQVASDRLGVAYRQAIWLILLVMLIAGVMVVAALIHISRSISAPLLNLADRMRRLAANDTEIDIPETERRDEIGEMAQATVVFRNNAIELMRSQRMLARQAAHARGAIGAGATAGPAAAQFRVHGLARVPHALDHHRRACPPPRQDQGRRDCRPRSANAPARFAARCCA